MQLVLGKSEERLDSPEVRLQFHCRAQFRNSPGVVPAKVEQDTEVSMCINILRIECKNFLVFGNGKVRTLLMQKLLRRARMLTDLLPLTRGRLAQR